MAVDLMRTFAATPLPTRLFKLFDQFSAFHVYYTHPAWSACSVGTNLFACREYIMKDIQGRRLASCTRIVTVETTYALFFQSCSRKRRARSTRPG